jgi:cyclohexa-1,5-dienecarbonyl-CoA hydratase
MSGNSTVRVKQEVRTAWVTLDRPPLNVMDTAMMSQLGEALAKLTDIDLVVVRGAGTRAFSAGAEVADHTPERVGKMLEAFHHVFRLMWNAEWITVSAVRGHCLGGGCELATFCDFVVAEKDATFGQPEIRLGCFPPVALVTLPLLAGMRAAMDLVLTGRTIRTEEARALGLVTRVVPEGGLEYGVAKLLAGIEKISAPVLRLTRRTMWRAAGVDFEKRLAEVESVYLGQLVKMYDAREGIQAFLEKRAPVWQGR